MKMPLFFIRGRSTSIIIGAATTALCATTFLRAQNDAPAGSDWPRSYSVDDDELVIYAPKVEKWDQRTIQARFAVGIKGKGDSQPIYGSLLATGETLANTQARTVSIFNITEDELKFPDAGKRLAQFKRDLAAVIPDKPLTVSMDQLVADVPADDAVNQDTVTTDTESEAPRVVVSYTPALLVAFDGEPVFRAIANTGLESAVNTSAIVLRAAGRQGPYYLFSNEGQWLTAGSVDGPWESGQAPAGIKNIPADNPVAVAIQNVAVSAGNADAPDVITTDQPTELVQIKGKPNYQQIGVSALVRVGNTDSNLFYHFDQSSFYVLISGRWFTAKELKGPWAYIAQDKLPAEFADIPSNDSTAEVRASIAGTPEAEEAVVEAQVPTKAQCSLAQEPDLEVQYDGEPQFEVVKGTECSYAVNTTYEVVEVAKRYYCCHDGVWFMADRPHGARWHLVKVLPRAIMTLPASCPLYHLRFCTIDNSTDQNVTYSCTSGYYGTYIDPVTHVCVYGTGYHYKSYVSRNYYVGYPQTYGYGCRWWRHHGFVYEGRHVVHTMWSPRYIQKDQNVAVWHAGTERWGGRLDKESWHPVVHSFEPYHSWGNTVVVHHQDLINSVMHNYPPKHVEENKPRVVYHNEPMERRPVVFEKNVHVGAQGEIYRHQGQTWEKREQGAWVQHKGDPAIDKRPRIGTPATWDKSRNTTVTNSTDTKILRRGSKEIEIRPAESSKPGTQKGDVVLRRQDSMPNGKNPALEKEIEQRGIKGPDGELPKGKNSGAAAMNKGDALPGEGKTKKGKGAVTGGVNPNEPKAIQALELEKEKEREKAEMEKGGSLPGETTGKKGKGVNGGIVSQKELNDLKIAREKEEMEKEKGVPSKTTTKKSGSNAAITEEQREKEMAERNAEKGTASGKKTTSKSTEIEGGMQKKHIEEGTGEKRREGKVMKSDEIPGEKSKHVTKGDNPPEERHAKGGESPGGGRESKMEKHAEEKRVEEKHVEHKVKEETPSKEQHRKSEGPPAERKVEKHEEARTEVHHEQKMEHESKGQGQGQTQKREEHHESKGESKGGERRGENGEKKKDERN